MMNELKSKSFRISSVLRSQSYHVKTLKRKRNQKPDYLILSPIIILMESRFLNFAIF